MTLSIFFPVTDHQKLTEMDKEQKLWTSYKKCIATEVAPDAPTEDQKDYVVWDSKGKDRQKFYHEAKGLDPWQSGLLLREQLSSYRQQRIERRKCKFALSALRVQIWELSVRLWGRGLPGLIDTIVPPELWPQRAGYSTSFLISLRKMISTSGFQEALKLEVKAPQAQCLATLCVLQDNH